MLILLCRRKLSEEHSCCIEKLITPSCHTERVDSPFTVVQLECVIKIFHARGGKILCISSGKVESCQNTNQMENWQFFHHKFDKTVAAPMYNKTLKKSPNELINYNNNNKSSASDHQEGRERKQSLKIIWFNPPFSKSMQTNVVRCIRTRF